MDKLPRIRFPNNARMDAAFARLGEAIAWACNPRAVAPLAVEHTAAGPVFKLQTRPPVRVKLTSAAGTTGSYNAVEVQEATGGGWAVVSGGWSGVVWEYNLTASLTTPAYATAEYCPATGDYRFQRGTC